VGGLRYHLRLAIASLRRDRRLTIAVFLCLALGSGMWTMIVTHYRRSYPPAPDLPPGLHQVEIRHPRALEVDKGTVAEGSGWHARTRVTFPEYELLAGSGIPTRQTGTYRTRLVVARDPAAPARMINVRFAGADFFGLFRVTPGAGRTFTRDEEQRGAAVAVVGRCFAEQQIGTANAVGRTLLIEGRPFQVVGVLGADQPERPEWDIVWSARDQDALYLPFDWGRRLSVSPGHAALQSPLADDPEALWRSDAVFVAFWMELPDAGRRAAYADYLARVLGPRGQPYWLRSYAAWRPLFTEPASDIMFFTIVVAVGLAGAAATAARLMLAKGLARRPELAIHRALGATRAALFRMQMLEAVLIAFPAAVGGIACGAALHVFYNRFVSETDMPVALGGTEVLIGAATAVAVTLLAAIYPAWRASRTPPTFYLGRV
jgi:putative ABC transport system permease protein